MGILIMIFISVLKFIYFFMKLLPTKNKITFISRQSNNINVDFELLKNDLNDRYKDYRVIILTKKIEGNIISKIKYIFHIIRQMYHISTSKAVVLDSYCIPISILNHKKSLKVIQMWHAMGSFKKFGLSIKDKKEGTSSKLINMMKMHQNYDYIFASSDNCKKYFAEAFGYSEDKILSYPLPRLDLLKDKKYIQTKKKEILNAYPSLKEKKNILYAPTFRIEGSNRRKSKSVKYLEKLIEEIDFSKYNLIVKFHPLSEITINDTRVVCDKRFRTSDFLNISDYIITDYSAIIYEVAFLSKPIYFYTYDLKNYLKNRDFYLDVTKDMPGLLTTDPKEIIKKIENDSFDLAKVKRFNSNNIVKCKKSYTKDINDFIINKIG